ncbi:MAG: hypothetical protein Kow00121_04590 [Elainellaceae cyanobacterium]
MHILIVALHRPVKPTGVCRHAVNLAQCLADHETVSQVSLVIGAWQKDYFATSFQLHSSKINWVSIDINNDSISRNLWFLFGLPKLLRNLQPDLVHLAFPLPFMRALLPCPVVTTIHDLYPYEFPENFGSQAPFNRLFLKQSVSSSDGLSCVSQATLDKLKFYFPNKNAHRKASVVYNYVDFSHVQPTTLSDRTIDFPFLLCVAQHRKNKNLDLLIQAFDLLKKSQQLDERTKLVLVGDSGPETENILHRIASLSLQKQILFLSFLDDSELCWLYQNCEVFVIPSATEGFCLPLVEALYLSCKVVCSDIPIFREVGSTQSTFFSLQGDPVQNLAEAIATTLPQAKQDNTFAVTHFSKTNAARQYLALYSAIVPQLFDNQRPLEQSL